MANNNKNKGKAFEREIAKLLTDLYGDNFLRNFDSGSFTGGKNSHKRDILTEYQWRSRRGDIICPDDWLNTNVECKSYQDLSFHQLIQQNCKQMDKWIDQTLDVARSDDINTIFFKITRKGKYVAVQDYPYLDKDNSLQYKDWYIFDLQIFFHQNKTTWKNACCYVNPNY